MMAFLEFTFAGLWHFVGVVILIGVTGEALDGIGRSLVAIVRRKS